MEFLHRLTENLSHEHERQQGDESTPTPPLQLFIDWLSAYPEPTPEQWEPVSQAVLEEVHNSHSNLKQVAAQAGFLEAEESFGRVFTILDWMADQLEDEAGERSPQAWQTRLDQLLEEQRQWQTWAGQEGCPECRRLNPVGWNRCAHCQAKLSPDEQQNEWRETTANSPQLPIELQELVRLCHDWRNQGQSNALEAHLTGLKARYEAALRQLHGANDPGLEPLRGPLQGALSSVQQMQQTPLQWERLDSGFRQLCNHLLEANQAYAELHQM